MHCGQLKLQTLSLAYAQYSTRCRIESEIPDKYLMCTKTHGDFDWLHPSEVILHLTLSVFFHIVKSMAVYVCHY